MGGSQGLPGFIGNEGPPGPQGFRGDGGESGGVGEIGNRVSAARHYIILHILSSSAWNIYFLNNQHLNFIVMQVNLVDVIFSWFFCFQGDVGPQGMTGIPGIPVSHSQVVSLPSNIAR